MSMHARCCVKVTPLPNPFVDDGTLVYVCHEEWPKPTARQFFTVTSLVLQYVVPVGFITYCYCSVSLALSRRARARASITGRTAGARCHGDREQVNSCRLSTALLLPHRLCTNVSNSWLLVPPGIVML